MIKALQCPFLTGIPISQVRQQAGELLQLADLCPVMGHVIKYASAANEVTGTAVSEPKGDFSLVLFWLLSVTKWWISSGVPLNFPPFPSLLLFPLPIFLPSPPLPSIPLLPRSGPLETS